MKKNKSSFEATISEHYFTVYPFSIQFAQEYNSKFFIYFEKNLQIISRFEIPTDVIRKQEIIYFPIPESIQHFRIQSDKNLQYQWSLYIRHQGSDGEDEQFAEGQKVNLKTQWSNYQNLKESLQEVTLNFNNMKCQLQFLIAIGSSNKDVLSSTQKHFGDKQSILTATQKVQPSKIIEIQKNEEKIQINNKNPEQEKIKQNLPAAPDSSEQSSKAVEPPQQHKEVSSKQYIQKESVIINKLNQNQQNIPDQKQSTQKVQGEINPKPITRTSLQPFDERPNYQVQLKLSNSQLDLCNQIEEEIRQSQSGRQNHSGQMKILQQNFEKNQTSEFLPEPVNSGQNQDNNIIMTNSQLLNEKGEVIKPFYKNKKIILLIVAVVIAIIGAVLLRKSILPDFPQNEEKQGTGEVKTNMPNHKRAQKSKGEAKDKGAKLQKTGKQGKSEKAGKQKPKSGKPKK